MSKYKEALVDHDGRLMCSKRHAKTKVKVHGDKGNPDWVGHIIEIECETCGEMLWYNGS